MCGSRPPNFRTIELLDIVIGVVKIVSEGVWMVAPPGRQVRLVPQFDWFLKPESENEMQIQYLEIVTPDVDSVCAAYEKLHGVSFSVPEAGLGNARTAALQDGGKIGVRAPMHESEQPVVRPYQLVDDVEAAAAAAVEAGGEIAHPPMELPGHGKFAIYIQGGIHHGLWQV
jgi:predicted enzyme related to lactoylglutathione lyase